MITFDKPRRRAAIALEWEGKFILIPLFDFGPGCAI